MIRKRFLTGIIAALLSLGFGLALVFPVQANQPQVTCVRQKHISEWDNVSQLQARGFFTEVFSPEGSLGFGQNGGTRFLALNVAATPQFTGQAVASRITEIDTSAPPAQRVKCWQPDASHAVVAEYTIRFDQAAPPPGLTENMILWNAPFGQNPIPLSAVGVTRSLNPFTGQTAYSAIVAQDLDFSTFSGLFLTTPMPAWLNAADWHTVRVTVSQQGALIEVSQGAHPFTPVLQTPFLHPPEPLGFEFSVDNEVFPGVFAPVTVPDGLDVGPFDIELNH